MNIEDTLKRVAKEYPATKVDKNKTEFKNNELVSFLSKGLPEYSQYVYNENLFVSNGSAGKGNWAAVPWIGVFDSEISKSAQRGFYIVYLFSADMQHVYLSLNQGWTLFHKKYKKNGAKKIRQVSEYFREKLIYSKNEYSGNIDLRWSDYKNTILPKGYELGNIISKEYSLNEIPSNDILENDLQKMIVILYQLHKLLIDTNNIESSISVILSKIDLENGLFNSQINENDSDEEVKLEEKPNTELKSAVFTGKPHKRNIELKQVKNSQLGMLGEKLVLTYEKNKLIKNGLINLAYKVDHSSKTKGDGLGYDIESFDSNGKKIYIEVKSTTGSKEEQFFLSETELQASEEYNNRYRLYRVFNVGSDEGAGLYIIKCNLKDNLSMEPVNYRALPKKEAN